MSTQPHIHRDFNPGITHPAYLTRNRLLRNIRKYAPELRGRLMDFGCGSKPYRSLFTNVSEYVGVDYDSPGHPHTNEQIDVFYDGKHLPFPDHHFDSIFTTEVFEHIFNLPEILAELNRVLKPGGKMLVTCPFVICEHEVPNDYARYTSFAMKHMLQQHDFNALHLGKSGNSIEAIFQLRVTYWHTHILSRLKNIPGIRSMARLVVYTTMNAAAICCSKLFPAGMELYLNNIVVAEKNTK